MIFNSTGTNQTGHLNSEEKRYFQYEFPSEGTSSLNINIQSTGELSGWYSYTEATPNSAVYDGLIQPGTTLNYDRCKIIITYSDIYKFIYFRFNNYSPTTTNSTTRSWG